MASAITTRKVELRQTGPGNMVLGRMSVPRGNYIITATCTMRCETHLNKDIPYLLQLSYGGFANYVDSFGIFTAPISLQKGALTLGGNFRRRTYIYFGVIIGAPSHSPDLGSDADIRVYYPSVTAVRVDDLYFDTWPVSLADFLSDTFDIVRKVIGGP